MARLTIYHRSPIIYRYVIRGVPGDESTNVGQYLVVRFVRATDKDTGKDCIFVVGSMMTAWAKAETIVPFGYASTMLSLNEDADVDEVPHSEIPYGSPLLPPHLIDICVVDSTDERLWFRHEKSAPLGGLFAASEPASHSGAGRRPTPSRPQVRVGVLLIDQKLPLPLRRRGALRRTDGRGRRPGERRPDRLLADLLERGGSLMQESKYKPSL